LRIVMIDNYDSFTYNLVQALGAMGHELLVFRNDAVTVSEIAALRPDRIVISPGPGRPESAGVSNDVIRKLSPATWTLGVCLGFQCIGYVFGMPVKNAPEIMHGKTSWVVHNGEGIHRGLSNPTVAMRYHSLGLAEADLPESLRVIARSVEGTLMGVQHNTWKLVGVQYHPESFLTPEGPQLLKNFVEMP